MRSRVAWFKYRPSHPVGRAVDLSRRGVTVRIMARARRFLGLLCVVLPVTFAAPAAMAQNLPSRDFTLTLGSGDVQINDSSQCQQLGLPIEWYWRVSPIPTQLLHLDTIDYPYPSPFNQYL